MNSISIFGGDEMTTTPDFTLDPHISEVLALANVQIAAGHIVLFKWTCKGCGERATSLEPNALHVGYLHEDCGYKTLTVDGDLGFMLVMRLTA